MSPAGPDDYQEYSADAEIAEFFTRTSATRPACDAWARELTGTADADGKIVPVAVQGYCSYSVYAGADLEYVVQFRLRSLALATDTAALASRVYGHLAPTVSFEGQVGGDNGDGREPLYAYLMSRVRGITHLDFVLRKLGQYYRLPQEPHRGYRTPVTPARRKQLGQKYTEELHLLLSALPARFRPAIQDCIDGMGDILSLPMVLLHKDLGTCNIMVDEASCRLVGVVDWAEAEVGPFGLNLHSLEALAGKLDLRRGWSRYSDHAALQDVFWDSLRREAGGMTEAQLRAVRLARVAGLLLSKGFTSRLANAPPPVPIRDDERGRYNTLSLDGFLINPETRFLDLDDH